MGKLSDFQRATDSPTFEGTPDNGLNGASGDMSNGTMSAIVEAQVIPNEDPKYLMGGESLVDSPTGNFPESAVGDGFRTDLMPPDVNMGPLFADEFEGGDTQIGNPFDKGGFLTRPNGWER